LTLPVETLKSVPRGKAVWNANGGFVSVLLTHLFVLIFAVFLPDFIFLYHNDSDPSFIQIVHFWISTPHKTERSVCGYTINTKEAVLW